MTLHCFWLGLKLLDLCELRLFYPAVKASMEQLAVVPVWCRSRTTTDQSCVIALQITGSRVEHNNVQTLDWSMCASAAAAAAIVLIINQDCKIVSSRLVEIDQIDGRDCTNNTP
jgi:hypothetical protein